MKSTKAIVFGFFIFLIALGLIGFGIWANIRSFNFDHILIEVAAYSTWALGTAWAIIGYGLMNGKKWLAERRSTLLRGSLVLIILQIILCIVGASSSNPSYRSELDHFLMTNEQTQLFVVIFFEIVFYFALIVSSLNSRKVQESLFR